MKHKRTLRSEKSSKSSVQVSTAREFLYFRYRERSDFHLGTPNTSPNEGYRWNLRPTNSSINQQSEQATCIELCSFKCSSRSKHTVPLIIRHWSSLFVSVSILHLVIRCSQEWLFKFWLCNLFCAGDRNKLYIYIHHYCHQEISLGRLVAVYTSFALSFFLFW